MIVWKKIKDWWDGEYIPPPENDPDSFVWLISPGWQKHPLPRVIVSGVWRFWCKEWRILLPIIAALAIAFLGWLVFGDTK